MGKERAAKTAKANFKGPAAENRELTLLFVMDSDTESYTKIKRFTRKQIRRFHAMKSISIAGRRGSVLSL
jgi:hypothetical protein